MNALFLITFATCCLCIYSMAITADLLRCEPPEGLENISEKDKCRLIPTWTWPGNPSGPCRAFFQKWYFDVEKKMCIRMNYGGCCGSDNLFDSEELCKEKCSP
uniref:Collagen, type VI, alpha 3 [Zonotrichia albicollis] n=1 Tax=Lepeophtheirus salmonis TaxID=72036 RepID=A0A0K2UYP7_LEPSM